MNVRDIREHLRKEPFEPLRFHVSDGAFYDISHPELALVSQTEIAIAVADGDGDLPERLVYCDPRHITRIEPISPKRRAPRKKR